VRLKDPERERAMVDPEPQAAAGLDNAPARRATGAWRSIHAHQA